MIRIFILTLLMSNLAYSVEKKVEAKKEKTTKINSSEEERKMLENMSACSDYASNAVEIMMKDLEFTKDKKISNEKMADIESYMQSAYQNIFMACALKYKPSLD